ncbi:MAG: hypothetical protein MUO67_19340, partial [Anaerolineales bacterium]|nr:hypothetical protein [Anaerolineales bacterium]
MNANGCSRQPNGSTEYYIPFAAALHIYRLDKDVRNGNWEPGLFSPPQDEDGFVLLTNDLSNEDGTGAFIEYVIDLEDTTLWSPV